VPVVCGVQVGVGAFILFAWDGPDRIGREVEVLCFVILTLELQLRPRSFSKANYQLQAQVLKAQGNYKGAVPEDRVVSWSDIYLKVQHVDSPIQKLQLMHIHCH